MLAENRLEQLFLACRAIMCAARGVRAELSCRRHLEGDGGGAAENTFFAQIHSVK
jgi:hypothetical protein